MNLNEIGYTWLIGMQIIFRGFLIPINLWIMYYLFLSFTFCNFTVKKRLNFYRVFILLLHEVKPIKSIFVQLQIFYTFINDYNKVDSKRLSPYVKSICSCSMIKLVQFVCSLYVVLYHFFNHYCPEKCLWSKFKQAHSEYIRLILSFNLF